jgi:hypothetical protein
LSEGTVRSVLSNLDNNKAHGPDEIPARLLSETAYQIAPSLCLQVNKSLKSGTVPREWKLANVVTMRVLFRHSFSIENDKRNLDDQIQIPFFVF